MTPVHDAATVVLLRDGADGIDGADGLEAWLLTRVPQMVFAPGTTVFPGGRVDPSDAEVPWGSGSAVRIAARLGCEESLARVLVAAAVRETFEETGVLLTRPRADLSADRADVEARRLGFGDLLRAHGLVLDAGAVRPWARWITPEGEVRRYDTRFFVAALPAGAVAQDVTSEASVAGWVPVRQALDEAAAGARIVLPPTRSTLREVAALGTVAAVLEAAPGRDLAPIRPVLRRGPDGMRVELPDGTSDRLPDRRLP